MEWGVKMRFWERSGWLEFSLRCYKKKMESWANGDEEESEYDWHYELLSKLKNNEDLMGSYLYSIFLIIKEGT